MGSSFIHDLLPVESITIGMDLSKTISVKPEMHTAMYSPQFSVSVAVSLTASHTVML